MLGIPAFLASLTKEGLGNSILVLRMEFLSKMRLKKKIEILTHLSFTKNSLEQFESFIETVLQALLEKSRTLVILAEKKTISVKEIESSVKILFSGKLQEESLSYAKEHLQKYESVISSDNSHSTRQTKAGIVFPPSVCEKVLRFPGFLITKVTPVYLACIMESLLLYISKLLVTRVTVRQLDQKLRDDVYTRNLIQSCNFVFLTGGVNTLKTKEKNTVAEEEIQRLQRLGEYLVLRRLPFEKTVRSLVESKISSDVCVLLQHYVEQYIVSLLQRAYKATLHANRVKMLVSDLELVKGI